MTTVVDLPSAEYKAPFNASFQFEVPDGVTRIRFTVTRESWKAGVDYVHPQDRPDNKVVSKNTAMAIWMWMPDGSRGGGTTLPGGDLYRDLSGKKLSPIPVPIGFKVVFNAQGIPSLVADPTQLVPIDILVTTGDFEATYGAPKTNIFPAGTYTLGGSIPIDLSTAVKIEFFP